MKLLSFLGACAVAAVVLPSAADAASGKGKPGYCDDDTDCAKTYTCVSVQTTRDGVENVKQCLPTAAGSPICTGIVPGLCPSFSTTWGTNFRQISSVCAYILPEGKGIKCIGDETATATNSTKGLVECLQVQNPDNETSQIGVIYGCVDFDGKRLLFEKNSKSDKLAAKFNYSEIIADNCVNPKNPQGSTFVCSSQGTCSPNSASSQDYACKCNIGFSGKYCEKIVNNKCYNDGVCGGGSCDLTTNECTNCTVGTMGDKCAQCDPTYDATKVCSAHGTCAAAAGSSSGSSSSGSTTVTKTPAATTAKPTTSDSSYSGNAAVSAPEDSSSSGATASVVRFLATTTSTYQCTCSTGYSGTQCDVKLKTNSSSSTTTTTAPSTDSAAGSLVASVAGVVIAAVVASFNL